MSLISGPILSLPPLSSTFGVFLFLLASPTSISCPSITSFCSYTSPWAIPPALYLNPALFPSPNATVGPPSDIYMKAFDPSIHLGRQGLGFRPSMVNEAEFGEIMKQTRAMPIPKWFLEPAQGTPVTRLRCCTQLLLLSNSLRSPVMSVAVSSSPLSNHMALKPSPTVWVPAGALPEKDICSGRNRLASPKRAAGQQEASGPAS